MSLAPIRRLNSTSLSMTTVQSGGSSGAGGAAANLIAVADQKIANKLAPFSNVIDQLPNPPDYPNFTRDLKNTPIEAMLSLVDPIRHFIVDVVDAANVISGRNTRTVGIGPDRMSVDMSFAPGATQAPASSVNESASDRLDMLRLGINWPANVSASHPTAQMILRMKAVLEFMILGYEDPKSLARGVIRVLTSYVQRGLLSAEQEAAFATGILNEAVRQFNIPLAGGSSLVNAPDGEFLKAMVSELKGSMPGLKLWDDARAALKAAKKAAEDAKKKAQADADAAANEAKHDANEAQNTGTQVVNTVASMFGAYGAIPAVDLHQAAAAAVNAAATASAAYASAKQSQAHVVAHNLEKPSPDKVAKANAAVKRAAQAVGIARKAANSVVAEAKKGTPHTAVSRSTAQAAVNAAGKAAQAADAAVQSANAALGVARTVTKAAAKPMDLPDGVGVDVMTLPPVSTEPPKVSLLKTSLPKEALPPPAVPKRAQVAVEAIQDAVMLHAQAQKQPGSVPPAALARAARQAVQAANVLKEQAPDVVDYCDMDCLADVSVDPGAIWHAWMKARGVSIMGLGALGDGGASEAGASAAAAGEVGSGGAGAAAAGGTTAEATAPATTPDISALITQVVNFVIAHPELVSQAFNAATSGGATVQQILDAANKHADAVPFPKKKPAPQKKPNGLVPFLGGAAVAALTFPVLGPAALAAGAATAVGLSAASKKKADAPAGAAAGGPPGLPGGGGLLR